MALDIDIHDMDKSNMDLVKTLDIMDRKLLSLDIGNLTGRLDGLGH